MENQVLNLMDQMEKYLQGFQNFGSKEKLKVIMNISIYLIIIEQVINIVKNFLLVDMELA